VISEFRAFRLEAAKHGVQFMNNPGQFWSMLLRQGCVGVEDTDDSPCRFDNMFKLHLLSVLIPTSSTDVERAFSHHKQILGVKRTRLHVRNIDSRLRGIELVKPILKQNGYKWAGLPETTEAGFLHPYQLYYDLAKDQNLSSFLSISLHTAVEPGASEVWLRLYEDEFEGVDAEEGISGHALIANDDLPYATSAEMQTDVDRMTALLSRGLDG
jgi:hypothetical protein